MLTIAEQAFLPFAETEDVPLVLRFDRDPKREVAATAWSSSTAGNMRSVIATPSLRCCSQASAAAIGMVSLR